MTRTTRDDALTGRSIVGTAPTRDAGAPDARTFRAVDPATGEPIEPPFHAATDAELSGATRSAAEAFPAYAALPGPERAAFLRRIADGLEARREALVARAGRETALPDGRLNGELARTTNQLRMFANLVEDDAWRDPRIDRGDPERTPAPKPDVRSLRRALGPVAVFGASNFPLAFSVAGGDTAAALAAGCPVIVKAHPGHPGTSEIVGAAIAEAAREHDLPGGVFSLLFDDGHEIGARLVQAPEIRAVGFTGSRGGGEALMRLAASRPVPIPVYAEMGSVNPVFVLPDAARERGEALAEGLHGSFTQGVGQFCTNPGVVLVPRGEAGDALVASLARRTEATPQGTMLNERVCAAYGRGVEALREAGGRPLARGTEADGATPGVAALWEVGLEDALDRPGLLDEVFGPSTLLVRYDEPDDLVRFARAMEGQLTATLQGEDRELRASAELVEALADRAGRVLANGYPTGVEVGPAMVHGGPFPATSDGRGTSVGTHAIERYTRLVAYQNLPAELLPEALRDG